VFESIGGTSGGPILQAVALCRKQGRIVSVGVPKGLVPVSTIIMLRRELDLRMAHCYAVMEGRHDYEVSIDLLASRRAPLGSIVTHRFALNDMDNAFAAAGAKTSGALKVQITGAL
jgi:L-iditol 2-dehydrogenase